MDNNNAPVFISFIIPVYNESTRLPICLDSIIKQNMDSIEIILVDDASTDDSMSVMQQYADQYPFIHVYHEEENRGQSHARNVGLEHASGEYIWFVDSDDYVTEGAIKTLRSEAERSGLDCVYFHWQREMDEYLYDTPQKSELKDIPSDKVFTGRELLSLMVEQLPRIPDSAWRYIVKRSFVEKIGLRFLEGAVYEDGIFGMEIYLKAKRVRHLREALYVYYNNMSSTGHRSDSVYYYACSFVKYYSLLKMGIDYISDEDAFISTYEKVLQLVFQHSDEMHSKLKGEDPLPNIERISAKAAMLYQSIYGHRETVFANEGELKKALLSDANIIVYGAGEKAKELARYIDNYGKRILAYVVSDEYYGEKYPRNPKNIFGVPVINLSATSDLSRNAAVICTTRRVHEDIVRMSLKERGFSSIIFV